ncbi:MAG TPA: polysaccharide deacetylase family protein [Chitinophagaceae bacterium]|nr:polysaccharide deacetylase family protein [Chitinophagaceae bacterium]
MMIYANTVTPRLQYITDFIGKEICGKAFDLTSDRETFKNYTGPKINYSNLDIPDCQLSIINCPLLFETGIRKQETECFTTNNFKAFFKTGGDYPFDIFAASFYLLSRYEEYLPHSKDLYGRYAHENSLAFKEGFLNLPLVNIWLVDFKKVLIEKFPSLTIHYSPFTFQPTYDIDEAYAYKYKGFLKTMGGAVRTMVHGQWSMVSERRKVISGKTKDPYDSYKWMDELHQKHNLQPVYFFHVAEANGKYDKNILPSHPAMKELIRQHAEKYPIGLHPSWQSGDDESLLSKELKTFENITGKKITSSRQHYVRFTLPQTFCNLIDAGITNDYSMGYGSINGFRASVASSFFWYDLEKEETTSLLLHPFCYMEANSFYEQKYSAQQALEEMQYYYHIVKSVNGTFISIWHNSFLGTEKRFTGWREVYKEFISGK